MGEKVKKPFYKKWWVWLLAVIIIGSIATGGEETATTDSEPETVETVATEEPKEEPVSPEPVEEEPKAEPVEEEKPQEPEMSVSQQNAVSKAEAYIDMTAFSKTGLIKQLEFDKFSNADATFAVNNLKVDWKEQAGKKAQDYIDMTSFSRQGLIDQLKFDGFTTEEATYGVDQTGL